MLVAGLMLGFISGPLSATVPAIMHDGQLQPLPDSHNPDNAHSLIDPHIIQLKPGQTGTVQTKPYLPRSESSLLAHPLEIPVLTVLVGFSDIEPSIQIEQWQARMFDSPMGVGAYFRWTSNDYLNLVNAGVFKVTLDYPHPDPGEKFSVARSIARSAMGAVAKLTQLDQWDMNGDGVLSSRELSLVIILAGQEKAFGGESAAHPNVWAHQSSAYKTLDGVQLGRYAMFGEMHGSRQASIGIIAHEMAHLMFDLPDLYDRDGSSSGIGRWGLMGGGVWNTSHGQLGDSPAGMLAWSKQQAGLVDTLVIEESQSVTLQHHPVIEVPINQWESFIVERRQRESFDQGLPGAGVLITHIDHSVGSYNDNEKRKLVDIEAADGLAQLDAGENGGDAGDTFPGIYQIPEFAGDTAPASLSNDGQQTGIRVQVWGGEVVVDIDQEVKASMTTPSSSKGAGIDGLILIFLLPLWMWIGSLGPGKSSRTVP